MSEKFFCLSCGRDKPIELLHSKKAGGRAMCKTCHDRIKLNQRQPSRHNNSYKKAKDHYQKGVLPPWMYS